MPVGRALVRGYGMATSPLRPLPDFLVVGGKRAGSTSLYYTLLRHPQVLPLFPSGRTPFKTNDTKGVHYFDAQPERSLAWYRSHFPSRKVRARGESRGPIAVGEASPYYLFHPLAAQRALTAVPLARIVVILRDPVERTFSHYREQCRNGVETLSFEEALAAEADRTAGEQERLERDPGARSHAHEQQSYRAQSEYAPALRRWLERYPRERTYVLASEDFYADPAAACAGVTAFLGLPAVPTTPSPPWNAAPKAPMSPQTRRRLVEHFAPFNAELEQLLGRSFPWSRP